jgi:hypothetical protein
VWWKYIPCNAAAARHLVETYGFLLSDRSPDYEAVNDRGNGIGFLASACVNTICLLLFATNCGTLQGRTSGDETRISPKINFPGDQDMLFFCFLIVHVRGHESEEDKIEPRERRKMIVLERNRLIKSSGSEFRVREGFLPPVLNIIGRFHY